MAERKPKLGIIIPEKDNIGVTLTCLFSIVNNCYYPHDRFTIYLADTGSKSENLDILKEYAGELKEDYDVNIKIIEYDYYNFAKINNDVIKNHIDKDTELILLMNNDIELIGDPISYCVVQYELSKDVIGTIGIRLMYPNLRIQHGGIKVTKIDGNRQGFVHLYRKERYNKKLHHIIGVKSAGNTGAFLLTPMKLWDEIGGLNENYNVCFEDVEYNLQCIKKGKTNVTLFNVCAYHRESYTRGKELDKNDLARIRGIVSNDESLKETLKTYPRTYEASPQTTSDTTEA